MLVYGGLWLHVCTRYGHCGNLRDQLKCNVIAIPPSGHWVRAELGWGGEITRWPLATAPQHMERARGGIQPSAFWLHWAGYS